MRRACFIFLWLICAASATAQNTVEADGFRITFPPGWSAAFSNAAGFPSHAFYQFVHPHAGHSLSVEIRTHRDSGERRDWMREFIRTDLAHLETIERLTGDSCRLLLPGCSGLLVSSEELNYRAYVLYVSSEDRDYRILLGGRANLFEESLSNFQRILATFRFRGAS